MTALATNNTVNPPLACPGSPMPDTEIVFCEKHGDYTAKRAEVMGKVFHTRCPVCQVEAAEEKTKQERMVLQQEMTSRIESLTRQAAIPLRFASRTFDNFRADSQGKQKAMQICRSMAEGFDASLTHGTSLLMCGKPGTGKSHLAAAMAQAVIKQGRSAVYTSVLRAVRSIKDTYRKDSAITEQVAINAYILPDLLILDEVGVQFGSETEKMYLFEILNGRYESLKPTIVITNLSPSEVSVYLGERIMDRLAEGGGGTLIFDWESYRSKVAGDLVLPTTPPKPVNWLPARKTF